MRTNSAAFDEFNQASSKSLRLVIKINFPAPIYLTSHADIPNIPANRIDDSLMNVSSTSQRLVPKDGRSEIGSMSFSVVDVAGAVTTEFRSQQAAGNGLNGRTVELYRGGEGMDWAEFRLEQTQQIDGNVAFSKGAYKVQCADIQRSLRADINDLAKTFLSADIDAAATTIPVFDAADFEACSHVASFSDQGSGSFFYIRIKYSDGYEICRATGKTATSFTGVTRGVLGTKAVPHSATGDASETSGVEIEEYVYLELPAAAMAYALLTGDIIGGGTIPTRWSLGIDTADVDIASFQNIGEDLFDSSDYTKGLILRFNGLKKTDGKRFIEREVCLLAGLFMRVGADGKLYLRRMTGIINSADYVAELNPDNAITHGDAVYDLSKIRNKFDIRWSYVEFPGESEPRYLRRNFLSDATSIAIHGQSKPIQFEFKGLHNERHTFTTLINRFDALRDRYAGPPMMMSLQLMPSMNDVEVGDIVRLRFPNVRDYAGASTLDRSAEIQRVRIDQKSGRVSVDVFGSTLKADPIADSDAGAASELPDGWYDSEGTELTAAGLSIAGGILQASGALAGGTTTRTIFYYLGDLTIASDLTLTLTGNVELRIRGTLQVNGTIDCNGGMPGNTAGYIGTTFGGQGVNKDTNRLLPAPRVFGTNSATPVLDIENDAGVLVGIPADMRGSGGGTGQGVWATIESIFGQEAVGGAGGAGGGSLVTVSRGVAYGVGGVVDLSGEDGTVGGVYLGDDAGSGGGGAPGALVHALDGRTVSFPVLAGNVVAEYGVSPEKNSKEYTAGKARAAEVFDLGPAAARVAYVPVSRTPYPDALLGLQGSSIDLVFQRALSQPSTPAVSDGVPSGWFAAVSSVPAGPGVIWTSYGERPSGESSYVWQTPVRVEGDAFVSALILSPRDWTVPVADPMGPFSVRTGDIANSSMHNDVAGPFAEYPLTLRVVGDGTASGWYTQWQADFAYDFQKSYVFYLWVRKIGSPPSNGLYVGADTGGAVENMDGTPTSNGYFIPNRGDTLIADKWYLAVGLIWGEDAVADDQGKAGLYDPQTGERVSAGNEFRWTAQNDTALVRFGFFENDTAASSSDGYEFCRPTLLVRNGDEPSIAAVLGAGAVRGEYRDIIFRRSPTKPATPTGNSPSGWTDDIPGGSGTVWASTGTKTASGQLVGLWSTPQRFSGPTFREAYSASVDYVRDDVVSYEGRSYILTVETSTGNAPSGTNSGNAFWDLIAAKGDSGETPSAFTDTIAVTGTGPVTLRSLADAQGYDGIGDATVTFTVANGITLTGNAGSSNGGNAGHAIYTGSWPAGATIDLELQISGTVRGGGGGGGQGGYSSNGAAGGNGGDAIFCSEDIDITVNSGGLVEAGGAGGGGGSGAVEPTEPFRTYGGGGGGGGEPNGAAGSGGDTIDLDGSAGSAGTTSGGGSGGAGASPYAGDGGDGGDTNTDGDSGQSSGFGGTGGGGGLKGYAIRKNGNTVPVTNNGTITGTEG